MLFTRKVGRTTLPTRLSSLLCFAFSLLSGFSRRLPLRPRPRSRCLDDTVLEPAQEPKQKAATKAPAQKQGAAAPKAPAVEPALEPKQKTAPKEPALEPAPKQKAQKQKTAPKQKAAAPKAPALAPAAAADEDAESDHYESDFEEEVLSVEYLMKHEGLSQEDAEVIVKTLENDALASTAIVPKSEPAAAAEGTAKSAGHEVPIEDGNPVAEVEGKKRRKGKGNGKGSKQKKKQKMQETEPETDTQWQRSCSV